MDLPLILNLLAIFVLLIFFYAWRMNKMDRKFDVHED